MSATEMKAKGQADQVKGKAKEAWGDLSGDNQKKAEGRMDQMKGKGKNMAGRAHSAADDITR